MTAAALRGMQIWQASGHGKGLDWLGKRWPTSVRCLAPAIETATETFAVSQMRSTCGYTAPPSTHSLILQTENNTIILVSASMICVELHAHGYGVWS